MEKSPELQEWEEKFEPGYIATDTKPHKNISGIDLVPYDVKQITKVTPTSPLKELVPEEPKLETGFLEKSLELGDWQGPEVQPSNVSTLHSIYHKFTPTCYIEEYVATVETQVVMKKKTPAPEMVFVHPEVTIFREDLESKQVS